MTRRFFILFSCWQAAGILTANAAATNLYTFSAAHDPDGIGKFYFGREIAAVMGHEGAAWLERPERAEEERPDLLMQNLPIRAGQIVADIGAGTGYYSRRLAAKVGPEGRVFAVDIQPEMVQLLRTNLAKAGITNVQPVLGTIRDPKLAPASVDWALLVDVYHEFSEPYEMMQAICRALKPGGGVIFVEFRSEDPGVPIKPLHKMSQAQLRREMTAQPLVWERTLSMLPRQHILIFRKIN